MVLPAIVFLDKDDARMTHCFEISPKDVHNTLIFKGKPKKKIIFKE